MALSEMYPGDATDCWAMGGCDEAPCAGAAGLLGDCLLPCSCNTPISESGGMDCTNSKLTAGRQYAFQMLASKTAQSADWHHHPSGKPAAQKHGDCMR